MSETKLLLLHCPEVANYPSSGINLWTTGLSIKNDKMIKDNYPKPPHPPHMIRKRVTVIEMTLDVHHSQIISQDNKKRTYFDEIFGL